MITQILFNISLVIFITYELYLIINSKQAGEFIYTGEEYLKTENKKETPMLMLFISLPYFVWCILGVIFGTHYLLYLGLLIIGLSSAHTIKLLRKTGSIKYSKGIIITDAILSLSILIYLFSKHYFK